MTSDTRRRVPLSPSYQPLATSTNRRIYIQNLVNILHLSILKRDWQRGYRVWAILIRCPEVDYKSSWHWGLSILNHLPPDAYSDPELDDAERAAETSEKKETYLRRLLQTVHRDKRPDILQTLILNMIHDGYYSKALEELDLYLPSYPYISSASLHTYAGLLCYWISLPESARGTSVTVLDGLKQQLSESVEIVGQQPTITTPSQSGDKISSRSTSTTPFELESSTTPSSSPAPGIQHGQMEQSLNKAMLRRAMGYFQSAVDIERSADVGGGKEEITVEKTKEGIAPAYLEQIRKVLLEPSSPEPDGIELFQRSQQPSLHDTRDDESVDGDHDEDYSIHSDSEHELELDEYGVPLKREPQSSMAMAQQQGNQTLKGKGRMSNGQDDEKADEKEEYSDASFD